MESNQMVYYIKGTAAEGQYKGSGEAWAAIKDGRLMDIRYKDSFEFKAHIGPEWLQNVIDYCPSLPELDIACYSSEELNKIKEIARNHGYMDRNPKASNASAYLLVSDIKNLLDQMKKEQFQIYMNCCKTELSSFGDVLDGFCTSLKFITKQ